MNSAAKSRAPSPLAADGAEGKPVTVSGGAESGPALAAPSIAIASLEDVERALAKRGIEYRRDGDRILSRCPVIVRTRGDSFTAQMTADGSLRLECRHCPRPATTLLRALGGANIQREEFEALAPLEDEEDDAPEMTGPDRGAGGESPIGRPHQTTDHHGRVGTGYDAVTLPPGPIRRPDPPTLSPEDRDALYRKSTRFPRLGLKSGRAAGFVEGSVFRLLWGEALGDSEGEYMDRAVAAMMARHPLHAVGRRPEDHRVRDLLFGSIFRNLRVPSFARMGSEPESWQVEATADLPGGQQAQARQFLALYRDHLRGLYRTSKGLPAEMEGEDAVGFLKALIECPPSGALVEGVAKGKEARYCHHPRYCPWCMGRYAEKLYRRLLDGPCNPASGRGNHLVLARVVMGTRNEDYDKDTYLFGTANQVIRALQGWACGIGAVGGLTLHQAGPGRWRDASDVELRGSSDHEHDLAIIFEVRPETDAARDRLRRATGIGVEEIEDEWPSATIEGEWPSATIEVSGRCMRLRVATAAAHRKTALRYLIFGTSAGHSLGGSGIFINQTLARTAKFGIDGLFRVMPWWCATAEQWFRHADQVKGRRLCEPFGSWRVTGADSAARRHASEEKLKESYGIAARRRQVERRARCQAESRKAAGRKKGNQAQAVRARDSRAAALEIARPIFEQLAAGGKVPGRRRLLSALAQVGRELPRRVVDDITAQLQAEHEGRV